MIPLKLSLTGMNLGVGKDLMPEDVNSQQKSRDRSVSYHGIQDVPYPIYDSEDRKR